MYRRPLALIATVLLVLSGTLGAAVAQEATPAATLTGYPELTITATDTGFEVPAKTPAGRTLVTFVNTGKAGAGMIFWKLPDGVTFEDLQTALPPREPGSTGKAPEAFYEATLPGAPGYAEPGKQTQALIDLPAGNYAVLTEEGGWATPLEVVPATDATPAAQPDPVSDADVELVDFAFTGIPETVATGQYVWKVTNNADQPHQMIVGKIPDGMTLEQVIGGFTMGANGTPVPGAMSRAEFAAVGGIEVISPGNTAWTLMDLPPGNYAAVCLVPDKTSGMLHVAMGMATVFTVTP
jgi:hypothetical protein